MASGDSNLSLDDLAHLSLEDYAQGEMTGASSSSSESNVTIPELLAIIIKNQTKILGLLGNWTVSGTTMTTYSGSNTLASYTLTKDSGDNIVGIQEN